MINVKGPHGGSVLGRRYIERDRKVCHNLIIKDYFSGGESKYPPSYFCRRYRMDIDLFKRILRGIHNHDDYFTQRVDAAKKYDLSPLQKMMALLKMLAYGCPVDSVDEYIQIGESTVVECLKLFCDAIIGVFEEQYLRKPNEDDIKKLLKEGKDRGFPGMLVSLDCMHWPWRNCHVAWHGTHTNGFKKVPTLILEAVPSESLWIWHAFFGMAGSNNDVSVLDRSPLFDDIVNGIAPPCNFVVQGHQYDMGYYLSDGIYPQYATLLQTISSPNTTKEKFFAKRQEVVRKDVERAFGILQARWHIVKRPSRMWNVKDIGKIRDTCIILHNMIIAHERQQGVDPESWRPLPDENVEPVVPQHDCAFLVDNMINRIRQVRDKEVHNELKIDIINHLWDQLGDSETVGFLYLQRRS
ncbi:uncharacterized protein LOC113325034 [Papaver somniferum]|uniref:uncharacterized protein LOC113325034 n=1 Tax=Papaver somniferum TaxID=3469 RepID=UPI000E6F749C|nr:uncharacterized protein LOC113325034 [Papaver somniferum]